jgi:hypothetical protein
VKSDRKRVASKLDPFTGELLALNDAGAKLPDIQQWLKERGMSASIGTISNFLARRRTARALKANGRDGYELPYYPKLKAWLDRMRNEQWRREDQRARARDRKARWYQRNKERLKKLRMEAGK